MKVGSWIGGDFAVWCAEHSTYFPFGDFCSFSFVCGARTARSFAAIVASVTPPTQAKLLFP